jgi:hypothetical protein
VRPEIVNFPVDLIEKPDVKQFCIIFFDGYTNAVGSNIINEHITGFPQNSQDIVLLSFLEIYSVIFHIAMVFRYWLIGSAISVTAKNPVPLLVKALKKSVSLILTPFFLKTFFTY